MKTEDLAKLLHDAGRDPADEGKAVNSKQCTYAGSNIFCVGGKLYKGDDFFAKPTGETCPRCNGTGFEPFVPWNETTDETRNRRRIQASFVESKVIVVDNELVRAAIMNCYDQVHVEILAEAFSRIDDDDVRDAAIENAVAELDRFKRMVKT